MSTLFDTYYDAFDHELTIGSPVGFRRKDHFIYGTVTEIIYDSKNEYKFVVIPNIGWRGPNVPELKKSYKISHKNILLITIKQKRNH